MVLMLSLTTIEASSFGVFDRIILVGAPLALPTIENGPDADATSALPDDHGAERVDAAGQLDRP